MVFDLDQLQASNADYVVVWGTEDPQQTLAAFAPGLSGIGYKLAHFSDGYMIYKRGVYIRLDYFIFKKVEANSTPNQYQYSRFRNHGLSDGEQEVMGALGRQHCTAALFLRSSFTVRYHEKWADEAQAWLLPATLT